MAYSALNQGFLIEAQAISNGSSESYDISKMIEDVRIKRDYLNQNMPLFVIDMRTTEEIRNFIRDNDVSINLSIYVYDISSVNNIDNEDTGEPTITDIYYSGLIRLYDKPYTTTSAKSENDEPEGSSQTQSVPMVYYRVAGIPEDIIQKNKTIINTVFNDAPFNDILVNLISNIETKNIYIEPVDNNDVKKNILIPPLTLIQAIQYLNTAYQLYDGPCNIFLDTDCTYVYNPLNKNFKDSNIFDYKIVSVSSTGNSESYLRPNIDWDTNNLRLVSNKLSGYAKYKLITGNTIGSDITYYSYGDGFNLVSRGDSSNLGYTKKRYFWNPNRNNIFESAEKKSLASFSSSLSLALKNMSPSYIRPTTNFILDSSGNNQDADGNYCLSQMSVSFSTNDNKHFTSLISLLLYKKKDNSN